MDNEIIVTIKEGIEILAFITLVKIAYSNSLLFHTAPYKMAQKIGVDPKTLNKYLRKCIELGLAAVSKQKYKGLQVRTYKFISYTKAMQKLLSLKECEVRYFPLATRKKTFKGHQKTIELALIGLNYKKQAHNAAYNFPNKINFIMELNSFSKLSVSERYTKQIKNRKARLYKKYKDAEDQLKRSQLKGHHKDVITGCRHAAGLIGKSPSTGNKRLKEWQQLGILVVYDIVHFTPVNSEIEAFHVIDKLKAINKNPIHIYSKKEKGIKSIYGKKVLGFSSNSFSYGTLAKKTDCEDKAGSTIKTKPMK